MRRMTNKEAINCVKRIRYYMEGGECWTNAEFEAMDMAIKALEQPDLCEDIVLPKAAIDATKTWGLIDGLSEGQAIEILADEEKLPSTQSKIIHCKDCKWHNGEINQCNAQVCASMNGEDFCSKGEEREK